MKADEFYQVKSEHSIPFYCWSEKELEDKRPMLSVKEQNALSIQSFKAGCGDVALISNDKGALKEVYIGTGKGDDALAIAKAVHVLPEGTYTPDNSCSNLALTAWALAQYRFDRYKKRTKLPRKLLLNEQVLHEILPDVEAIFLTRDLINTPAADMGPSQMAEILEKIAMQFGAQFEQYVGDALLEHNFPAIHAVGRAAADEPRLLSLTWGEPLHPKVTLVGKGVCFDSGGLDLKKSKAMRFMKKDMGGAAQVMGLAQWVMQKQLSIRLQVYIPAVENAIGSQAFRPGDILKMRNGLTVEVDNTDAEGRLVLADALAKACEEKPELLIDFATLTGAARVAVGTEISALFTDNDDLAHAILKAGERMNDPVWRLPMYQEYASDLNSSIADLANSGASPYGGATTAALFLQRFIDSTIPWAHFDIMAWNVKSKPGRPEGGEAMAMRAIGCYLESQYHCLRD